MHLYLRLLTFSWQNSESLHNHCMQAIPASSNHNLHTKQPKKLVSNVYSMCHLKACLMDPLDANYRISATNSITPCLQNCRTKLAEKQWSIKLFCSWKSKPRPVQQQQQLSTRRRRRRPAGANEPDFLFYDLC